MGVIDLWWLSLGIAGVVIVIVAILLGLIIAAAKSIDRHAAAIWVEGKKIAGNTVSIWILEQVDEHVENMAETLEKIEHSTSALSESLRSIGLGRKGRL